MGGPDGHGKNWALRGPTGSHASIRLTISDGALALKVESDRGEVRKYSSVDNDDWHDYFLVTADRDQGNVVAPMDKHPERDGMHTFCMTLGRTGFADFRIIVDRDFRQALYPDGDACELGEGAILGPGPWPGDTGLAWRILGRPGEAYDVTLDL